MVRGVPTTAGKGGRSYRGPRSAPARQSEQSLHIAVAGYLRLALPPNVIWFHTPNGGLRTKAEAGKLRTMGVLAGVPDIVLIMPNAQASFIELKAADGALSDDQEFFRRRVMDNGCAYRVARSLEEVERIITAWLLSYDLQPRARLLPSGVIAKDTSPLFDRAEVRL